MSKPVGVFRRGIIYISTLVLVAGYPAAAMATTQEPVTAPEETITTTTTQETLASEDSQEEEHTYIYDPVHKKWNSEEWQWNPETETYERPPEPIIIEPEQSPSLQDNLAEVQEESTESITKNNDTTVNIDNDVLSDALSGNATVSGNTSAGSALTGDAEAVANIINAVNSSVSAGENQKVATFTKDIYGDVEGDIILYPMLLKAMLEAQAGGTGATEINNTTNFNLNNNVELNATTGNATVEGNTSAGDATTGNAAAMANIVNILNSMIATQDSFMGTINIYGSLEGDILVAPDFIPQMLANNGGSDDGSSTKLSTQDTTTIVNNISAVAESGAASVFGNTTAGNATTGDADTGVVIFNVTGRDIVAENSMLVFVNVLGRWVGMIVDAPAGANAAMIGNGVTTNEKYAPDLTVQSQSMHGITNTVAVNARSGDAVVANNTTAGNATTGNTSAFANIANVSNSSLSLTGWFGILFINITGDWFGSFGIDTEYGNKPEESVPVPAGPVQFIPRNNPPAQNIVSSAARVIVDSRFLGSVETASVDTTDEPENDADESDAEVMGVMDDTPAPAGNDEANNIWFLVITGVIIVAGGSLIVRRVL